MDVRRMEYLVTASEMKNVTETRSKASAYLLLYLWNGRLLPVPERFSGRFRKKEKRREKER